ncbi:MAG TPA: hypothetical protein V6D29_18215 [Leptolyngbyaceae cyanobacterium]
MKKNKRIGIYAILLSLLSLLVASGPAWALSWTQVTNWLNRESDDKGQGGEGGSRPTANLCLLSPGNNQRIWSLSPTLVWQGMPIVGIRPAEERGEPWQVTATETVSGAYREPYTGPVLERGKQYEWLFFTTPDEPSVWFPFQVVDQLTHWRISRDLNALQTQLETEGATPDAIALARANYFMENDLPADAIHEMFAVSEPSDELVQARETLVQAVCSENGG